MPKIFSHCIKFINQINCLKIQKNHNNFVKNCPINKDKNNLSLGINKSQSQSQSTILINSKHSIKDSLLTNLNISNQKEKEIKNNEIINIIKLNINKIIIKPKRPFNKTTKKSISYRDKNIILCNDNDFYFNKNNVNKNKDRNNIGSNKRIIRIINKNKINYKRRNKFDKYNSVYLFGIFFLFIFIIFFIENNL